jgi:hypothetical protein
VGKSGSEHLIEMGKHFSLLVGQELSEVLRYYHHSLGVPETEVHFLQREEFLLFGIFQRRFKGAEKLIISIIAIRIFLAEAITIQAASLNLEIGVRKVINSLENVIFLFCLVFRVDTLHNHFRPLP